MHDLSTINAMQSIQTRTTLHSHLHACYPSMGSISIDGATPNDHEAFIVGARIIRKYYECGQG